MQARSSVGYTSQPTHSLRRSLQYLSLRNSRPQVNHSLPQNITSPETMSGPDPIAIPNNSSINNLPLDVNPYKFYSLPIFDTRLAIPPSRSQFESAVIALAVPLLFPQSFTQSFGPAPHPASPDGGQHTT